MKKNKTIEPITWPYDINRLLSEEQNRYVNSVIQKLNWNIDEFNLLINYVKSKKDIVYLVVLCDWIKESCNCIYGVYEKYSNGFIYPNKDRRKYYNDKFTAIRSFIVAHPLATSKHENQGYNGTKKCIDISLKLSRFDEAFCNYDTDNSDFYLVYYEDNIAYKNEGHKYSEIYSCIYSNVERIKLFGEYLSKNKKD